MKKKRKKKKMEIKGKTRGIFSTERIRNIYSLSPPILLDISVNIDASNDRSKIVSEPREIQKRKCNILRTSNALSFFPFSFSFIATMFLVSLHPCAAIRHATSPPLRIYITGRWNRDIETGNETLRADEGDTKRRG